MRELGISNELDSRLPNQTYFDVAKMFNPDPLSGQQHRMESLCKEHLNLSYKKPSKANSHPFAATEAQISMALFHALRDKHSLAPAQMAEPIPAIMRAPLTLAADGIFSAGETSRPALDIHKGS